MRSVANPSLIINPYTICAYGDAILCPHYQTLQFVMNEKPHPSGKLWKATGLLLSIILGIGVHAIIQSQGFRGRGTVGIAVLCGTVFWGIWVRAVGSRLSAVFATIFVVFVAGIGGILFIDSLNQKPVQPVAVEVSGATASMTHANRSSECNVILASASIDLPEVNRGQTFSQRLYEDEAKVCILSSALAERIFLFEDPLGKIVHVSEPEGMFQVLGTTDLVTDPPDVVWLIEPGPNDPEQIETE